MLPISHLLLPVETNYYNYKGYMFPSLVVIQCILVSLLAQVRVHHQLLGL